MGPYFFRNPFGFYPFPRFYRPPYGYYSNNQYQEHKYEPHATKKNYGQKNKPDESGCNSSDSIYYDRPIFELFGVKLFFDDILIISLIFFLYNEGVKDQSLFISLILLLLS